MASPRPKTEKATDPTQAAPQPTPGDQYTLEERKKRQLDSGAPHVDLDEIHTSDGLFSVISQRKANGGFTFACFKAFVRNGTERTSFIPEEMGEGYIELVRLTLERIAKIRASGTAPFKERGRS